MRTVNTFHFLTINGYFKGPGENTGWHQHDEAGAAYSERQLKQGNILVFGRKTYEMMFSYWPTPMAAQHFPTVAPLMNAAEKLVLSSKLKKTGWANTILLRDDAVESIRRMKQTSGKNLTILGSGSVVRQLSDAGLIDEYEFLIDPLAIGKGTSLFEGMNEPLNLTLIESRTFGSGGSMLLKYKRRV